MMGRRWRWFGGVALPAIASGFMLANMTAVAPVHAAACTGANDDPSTTGCSNGSTATGLTYVGSNADYVNGNFTLLLNNHDVTAGGIAFSGVVGGDGIILLRNGSDVTHATDDGINASADAAGDGLRIEVESGSSVSGAADGIDALSAAGAVVIQTEAGTTVIGTEGNGIQVQAAENILVEADGNVAGGNTGINVNSTTGQVRVLAGAGTTISGTDGSGIDATGNSGNLVGVVTGEGSSVTGTLGDGIAATNTGGGGVSIEVGRGSTTTGNIDGLDAQSASGAIIVTMEVDSKVSAIIGNGIEAHGTAGGSVRVITGQRTVATGGSCDIGGNCTGANGIRALALRGGFIAITNGGSTSGLNAGIDAESDGGSIRITNTLGGSIANLSLQDTGLAIHTAGSNAIIDNENGGTITGRVETGIGSDVLKNNGRWFTEGASNFGGGNDTMDNSAEIFAGIDAGEADITDFVGLDLLRNSGVISLVDQQPGNGNTVFDRLQTSGDYVGIGGALIRVDAFLGPPGSGADVFAVGGDTSGVTRIELNRTDPGLDVFDPAGILVVDVAGVAHEGDFVLANGPIDKGLFVYDLVFNNFDQLNDQFLLMALADNEAFETLATISGSQEIWRETTNAWDARQQAVRDRLSTSAIVTAVADPVLPGSVAPENGLWFSALGSWTERNDRDFQYDQSIYGFVAGVDFAADLGADSSLLFGVLAGYVDSSLNFDASATSIKTDGATIGAYASLLQGGFFANVLVQADLLNLNFSAPSLDTDTSDDADVTSIGARADIGYRFDAGDLFIEPMLSADAISTAIDEFSLDGADIDAGTNESFRGGAGLRAGFTGETARASLTGRIWNVFATDNEVTIALEDAAFAVSDDSLEGLYGEISGQVDVDLSETTVLFAKGGVLFSDDITKPSVSGGFNFTW